MQAALHQIVSHRSIIIRLSVRATLAGITTGQPHGKSSTTRLYRGKQRLVRENKNIEDACSLVRLTYKCISRLSCPSCQRNCIHSQCLSHLQAQCNHKHSQLSHTHQEQQTSHLLLLDTSNLICALYTSMPNCTRNSKTPLHTTSASEACKPDGSSYMMYPYYISEEQDGPVFSSYIAMLYL